MCIALRKYTKFFRHVNFSSEQFYEVAPGGGLCVSDGCITNKNQNEFY